ncbi:MAG: AI-2E family transporter [Clostridia bacterium]|jgi:predicted PurR-regulated permease PerM|nr:AI-2E family transporter [Clostridia bacterium]
MKEKKFTRWLYWFILGVAIIAVYKLLDNLGPIASWIEGLFQIVMPFIIGLLIAYLFYIPCKKVEKTYKKVKNPKWIAKRARGLSIITVYMIALLVLVIALNVVIPTILKSITDLVNNFGTYYNNTMATIEKLPEDSVWKNEIIMNLAQNISQIDLKQFFNVENLLQYAKGAIDAVTGIFNVFVAFIVSVYLLAERSQILNFLKRLASSIFEKDTYIIVSRYFNKSNEVFFKFIASQVLDAIIVGILTSIAMSIIGVKYAVLLGFMIGLFNLIPYFGAIIAITVAIIITLFTGGLGQAALMAVIVIILQQIDANIINPKIIGNSLSISPLLVIFAVTVGGAYFGVLGMFLAVPVCTVLKLLIEEYIDYKARKKEVANNM